MYLPDFTVTLQGNYYTGRIGVCFRRIYTLSAKKKKLFSSRLIQSVEDNTISRQKKTICKDKFKIEYKRKKPVSNGNNTVGYGLFGALKELTSEQHKITVGAIKSDLLSEREEETSDLACNIQRLNDDQSSLRKRSGFKGINPS